MPPWWGYASCVSTMTVSLSLRFVGCVGDRWREGVMQSVGPFDGIPFAQIRWWSGWMGAGMMGLCKVWVSLTVSLSLRIVVGVGA